MIQEDLQLYTLPTYFVDSNHEAIINQANLLTRGIDNKVEQSKVLFYYVRDTFSYYTYNISFKHKALKASNILLREGIKRGFCIEKSILFAALCRAKNIPNRLVFCNVKNHIGVEEIIKLLGTDLLVFHGYNEVFLNGKWVKCTVAFNKELCYKLNVNTLEFDGVNDYIFQEYDKQGGLFMAYEKEYGSFHEFPHDLWIRETKKYYSKIFDNPSKWIEQKSDEEKQLFNLNELIQI